jgi:F-type H+-transporting ATPase subunit beta
VQAIYVPADDLTDPAPATSFAHLDATTVLSRDIAAKGIYPAVDPLDSTSRMLSPMIVGEEHYNTARIGAAGAAALQGACRTSSPFWAWTSCRKRTSSTWRAPARSSASCRSRSTSPKCSPARPASSSTSQDTINGFKGLIEGKYDHLPEAAFYMVGTIEEAVEKGKKLAAEAAIKRMANG